MAINIIYPQNVAVHDHAAAMIVHIDKFFKEWQARDVLIDDTRIIELCGKLASGMKNFPHRDGFHSSSPFKKMAYFFTLFVEASPIIDVAFKDGEGVDADVASVPNYLNTAYAYNLVCRHLHRAKLIKTDGTGECMLIKRIRISMHTWKDLLDACHRMEPESHYKIMALLFESLAYRANPEASYEVIM